MTTNNTAAIHADLDAIIRTHGVPAILDALRDVADMLRDHIGDVDNSNPCWNTPGNTAGTALTKMSQSLVNAAAHAREGEESSSAVDGAPDLAMANDVLADMEADCQDDV